ncbi:ATP-binding protein [Pectobacterium aquaticum]|uniref:histidine kinase n=1 Tax=Pectobacterium aquaticum TaxID=2204145 RepID=A0A426JBI3_9GAMM|nr:sensor histidine kinase [Pectobacterium aquaticum]MCH5049533.1 sensor histidine kinase [Pectobacterium aquaticum]PLY38962.1 histidine kinase [Pectobacterium carotovorum]RRO10462.1 sensor histidine kinase [Pectobacterium aquaticum]
MRVRLSFHIKLFIYLIVFFSSLLLMTGIYYYHDIDKQLYSELGTRAQVQAREIAIIPSLVESVKNKDIKQIDALVQQLKQRSDASYIVIGDNQARHLFHSEYAESDKLVGTQMVGGDNFDVLAGKSVITVRHGSIGVSLRSKAPIVADGQVIGIVSVGYLKTHIDNLTFSKLAHILLAILAMFVALFLFSWWFSRNLKKQMFGLEPLEIRMLVRQQKALLESIYEGVIAIDKQHRIAAINHAAKEILGLNEPSYLLRGKPIDTVIKPVPFFSGEAMWNSDTHDEICRFNHATVIASRVRIMLEDELQGWVISFRSKNDIHTLSMQLSQVKRYANSLRILRHEQLNWTATLAGLLHLKRYDEAIKYIEAQSESAQVVLDFVSRRFCSPALCGLLLGKYATAREKGIEIVFDPRCQLTHIPPALSETELMSIIGNLLDNAMEATLATTAPHYPVEVYIYDSEKELVIEVADQGTGIDPAIADSLFEIGVTSKTQGDHGLGLHLVASYVNQAQGMIEVSANQPNGSIFSLFIPMSPQ